MERTILHCDCNGYFASVECIARPELWDVPMAVCGDPKNRHGVILAKNELAKGYGIVTAETVWQALRKCPKLTLVRPHHEKYGEYSRRINDIYQQYTDQVEAFSVDESWLDVTASLHLFGTGKEIADELRRRIRMEIGLTISVGVSFSKTFAKLGSDCKKPDAVTVISKENFKETVWPLPVEDLLYVGPATRRKLNGIGIHTIGELARTSASCLHGRFGKWGDVLHDFSNGFDLSPVAEYDSVRAVKSVGNSATTVRNLENDRDVKLILFVLAESVGRRMREQGLKGRSLFVSVRDDRLYTVGKQCMFDKYTNISSEIAAKAFWLFRRLYTWHDPIRSVGISVSDLAAHPAGTSRQRCRRAETALWRPLCPARLAA